MGPWHACNYPYFIGDCNEPTCNRYNPNLDNHIPGKYRGKTPLNGHQRSNHLYNNNSIGSQSNGHNDQNA